MWNSRSALRPRILASVDRVPVKLLLDENISPAAAVALNDFEKLVRTRELHAGVVLIERADLRRDEQIELVKRIAAALLEHGDLVNEVLRMGDDGTMSFEGIALPIRS